MYENAFWRPVKCSAYLKKVNDGRFIELVKGKNGTVTGAQYWGIGDDLPDSCDCEGALDFLKTYYEVRKQRFGGISVGERDVVATTYLFADTNSDWDGSESIVIGKQPEKVIRCAVVYFGPNQKRFVPLEFIEYEDDPHEEGK